ncbi:hypothetical protein ACSD7O_07185 [Methylorubrum extorquens]|uniref:hypothetical protein n=1 Tax=Methylorubrum extorquens TaxID=408 RepID=UPI003F5E6B23
MLHEVVHTIGRSMADTLACQMPRPVRDRFSPALHSVAHCCDAMLTNPGASPYGAEHVGISIADRVVAGEAIIIFADAHPRRGLASASVYIDAIVAAAIESQRGQTRSARALEAARRISRAVNTSAEHCPPAEVRQRHLIELAGRTLDAAALDRLRLMSGCVPLVAIVGDTRATGATRGQFFHSVTQMPGRWLGTAAPAGAA